MSTAESRPRRLRTSGPGLRRALLVVVERALFAVVPVVVLAAFLAVTVGDQFAFDFRQFREGARDVVQGFSPYADAAELPERAALASLDPVDIQEVFRFPYPAPVALALVPFALVPFAAAAAAFTALSITAVALALVLLGVRDWRCYGVALLSITTLGAVRLGSLTPLLLLGLAVTWRYRDRRWVPAAAVAAVVVAKLFLWPLLVWLVATRRTGTALRAVGLAVVSTVAAWAVLGFAGLSDYPVILARLAETVQGRGYSLVALALAFEAPAEAGRAASAICGVAVLCLAVVAGRRPGGERAALAAALAAALLLTPIVWLHYFLLLLVPIALARPTLHWLWVLPLGFWAVPFQETDGEAWRIAYALSLVAVVLVAAARLSLRDSTEPVRPGRVR